MQEVFGLLRLSSKISLHSSFKSSFNLKADNIIANISINKTTLPPYGIVLNEVDFLYVKEEIDLKDLDIKISGNMICINDINILIEDVRVNYSSDITIDRKPISKSMIEKLKGIITLSGKDNGFSLDNEELLNIIIYNGQESDMVNQSDISVFVNQLNNLGLFFKDDKSDISIVKYFLGRGQGLTPSGDDFLVGAMVVFYSMDQYRKSISDIRHFVLKNIGVYTNDISEQFLLLATEGKFSRSIINLIEELKDGKVYSDTINNVLKYGGTSGMDIMLGIVWATTITN